MVQVNCKALNSDGASENIEERMSQVATDLERK